MEIVQLPNHFVRGHSNVETNSLLTDEQRMDALSKILAARYSYSASKDFITRIMDTIMDNAFCKSLNTWYELRVIKEINHYVSEFGYTSLQDWVECSEYSPTPFLNKDESKSYLISIKAQEMKMLMLESAKKIHSIFFQITSDEIDDLIPYNLLEKISLERLHTLRPFIDNIIENQATKTLESNGFSTWTEWESSLKFDTLNIKHHSHSLFRVV